MLVTTLGLFFLILMSYLLRSSFSSTTLGTPHQPEEVKVPAKPQEPPKPGTPDHPIYKPDRIYNLSPIVDNFPLAAAAQSATDLPPIPPWNLPPSPHIPEKTPLFIGFTRNWALLQQTVVSWVTAGWPPEDIYVVENTGTMKSNELGLLSLQNPFFLNHTRLHMFGVNILTTPTLLTFAQLQNFFLWTAIEMNYTTYFWGHMDVLALSVEDHYRGLGKEGNYEGFQSIYKLAVDAMRKATSPEPDPNASDPKKPWAARFFAYDRLALVNRAVYESIGGFDTAIPYYHTDCDMHDRLKMYGFEYNFDDIEAGIVYDVANSLDDLLVLYRKKDTVEASFTIEGDLDKKEKDEGADVRLDERFLSRNWVSDFPGSAAYMKLRDVGLNMTDYKKDLGGEGRNIWQGRQKGGQGEPYYRDPEGFEISIEMTVKSGREIYAEKWGHRDCGLLEVGRKAGDEWRVEHDWE
jgi:hypothetical protein